MEPVVDFGLFEVMGAMAIGWLARHIYSQRPLAFPFLLLTVVAPFVLVILSHGELARGFALVCLATSLVNGSVVFGLLRSDELRAAFREKGKS